MQFGLLISVLFHVAILGGALISIHSRAELRLPVTEPVAVGMIAPGDVTKVKLGTRTAKLLEAAEARESPEGRQARKEATKPKMAAAAPPPPPPPAAEDKADKSAPKAADPPPPAPAPAAEALKKLEAEQKKAAEQQQKQAEEQRLAEEKKRAEAQDKAEAMRRAEAQKRAEEQKKQADDRKRADEQKLADERRRAEAEQKRQEEQRKQAEELKKRKDHERRLKIAHERKEKQRKAAEAAKKKKLEEEKARQEAEASKKQFDADKIAALINKVPDKGAPPPPSAKPDQPTKAKGPTLGAGEGRDKQISAGERAMLLAEMSGKIRHCWKLPAGGGGSDTPSVKLRWWLKPDGTLDGEPKVLDPRPDPLFRLAAEAALRAVKACEPFDFLPPKSYQHWRMFTWEFDPSKML